MKNKAQHFIWSSIFLIVVSGIASCSKPGVTQNSTPISYVSILNLAPYGSPVDIFFNGVQVSPNGGIAPGQFSTQYGQIKPGSYTIDVKKTGTDSLLVELPAASYDTATFYTLLIYNSTSDTSATSATRILDDFTQVNSTSAYYRFFDMTPDASGVNLLMNNAAVQLNRSPADNISNTSFDNFMSVSPQGYTLTVQNSSDSVLATNANYPFAAGNVYTIFLTGTEKSKYALNVLPVAF